MKATYKNALRSKQLIRQSLIAMLDKKGSFDDITVSDICKEANINRGTFYNHYGNTTDVLEEIKDELMKKLTTSLKIASETKNIDTLVDVGLEQIEKNDTEYRKIIRIIPMSVVDKLKQEFISQINSVKPNIDDITMCFIVNAIAGVYIDFLKGNVNYSYEKLKAKTKEFVKRNLCFNAHF